MDLKRGNECEEQGTDEGAMEREGEGGVSATTADHVCGWLRSLGKSCGPPRRIVPAAAARMTQIFAARLDFSGRFTFRSHCRSSVYRVDRGRPPAVCRHSAAAQMME